MLAHADPACASRDFDCLRLCLQAYATITRSTSTAKNSPSVPAIHMRDHFS